MADGSIIAAVIVSQIPRYQPGPPRSVPGPASIPRMRCTLTTQATSAAEISRTAERTGRAARKLTRASAAAVDGFDVVPVGVEHEGAVVAGVVVRPLARRAVV